MIKEMFQLSFLEVQNSKFAEHSIEEGSQKNTQKIQH